MQPTTEFFLYELKQIVPACYRAAKVVYLSQCCLYRADNIGEARMAMNELAFREAVAEDIGLILSFIRALAEYEHMTNLVTPAQ